MSKIRLIAAVDMGAESGRVSLGRFDGDQLEIEVVHRFLNRPVRLGDTLYWNLPGWFDEILTGLRKAKELADGPIAAVGVDTWGVDFGILDAEGKLLGMPVHYRDKRTEGMMEDVDTLIPRLELYAQSGIACLPFNTIYQLRALEKENSPLLREGQTLLFIPDLIHYYLCGVKACERSIASTSACLGANEDVWLNETLEKLGIPARLFPEVVPSGTILGPLLPEIAEDTGITGMQVITPAGHDTACAVAAAPLSHNNAAYLSCGTWSLLGMETDTPCTDAKMVAQGFTNEKGVGQSYRMLKNIMGLWLVQQARASWSRHGELYDYRDLAWMAENADPFRSFVNPNDMRFFAPTDMVAEVRAYCAETGQPVPTTVAQVMRTLLESLAFAYRHAVDGLEELRGVEIPALHIIGGGAQNKILMQWTSNVLARPVTAGPYEGTTMGNMLIQLMALGDIKDQDDIRRVVRNSSEIVFYVPKETEVWAEAYEHYRMLIGR